MNVANTNTYNSTGAFLFLSNLFDGFLDLDLRTFDIFNPLNNASSTTCLVLCDSDNNIDILNTNDAAIQNDIEVTTDTGGNSAEGVGETTINTEDAFAAANVINVANTNIVGRNWLTGIINIFGNWTGHLTFGVPDLWVGARASMSGSPLPDIPVTYTYTVINNGNAMAPDVILADDFDKKHISNVRGITQNGIVHDTQGFITWELRDLDAGEYKEVSYTANLTGMGYDDNFTFVNNYIGVESSLQDANYDDNFDFLSIKSYRLRSYDTWGGNNVVGAEPNIEIQKSNNTDDQGILPCDQVEFTIVVKNTGGTAYDGVLWDVMYDPFGDIVYEEYWELGDLATGDELLITYGVDFATTSPWGIFTNVAEVSA